MTLSRKLLALALALPLAGCAPGALAAFFGVAQAVAPVVSAAIDAYTAHAHEVVPSLPLDSPIVVELARLFAEDDRCRAAVVALPPVVDAGPSDAALVAKALEDSAAATKALLVAVDAARAAALPPLPKSVLPVADAGGE